MRAVVSIAVLTDGSYDTAVAEAAALQEALNRGRPVALWRASGWRGRVRLERDHLAARTHAEGAATVIGELVAAAETLPRLGPLTVDVAG